MEKTTITNNVGTTLNTDGLVKAIAEASKATENPISQKDVHSVLSLLKTVVNDTLATGQKIFFLLAHHTVPHARVITL